LLKAAATTVMAEFAVIGICIKLIAECRQVAAHIAGNKQRVRILTSFEIVEPTLQRT